MVEYSFQNDATTLPLRIRERRDEALRFLMGRINYERSSVVPYGQRQLKLDRMRQLLNRLGNPDAGLPIVHIAGTKGKGSTSALVASVLNSAGYDVGLFSSPHLERIEERFAINGSPCSGEELVALVDRLRPIVQAMDREAAQFGDETRSPTYFELTTAIALMYFAQRQVDLAVLEVGLGGRLDSTNVCQPVVTLITSISYDHTRQLGSTLSEIAREKAGIIKPGVPLLCGPLDEAPRRVIHEIARQHGCRLREAERDFHYCYHPPQSLDRTEGWGKLDLSVDYEGASLQCDQFPLGLVGEHQGANAALAVAAIVELKRQGWLVSTEAVRDGLRRLNLPGRREVLGRRPTVVLDVAHNVASAQALANALRTSFDCDGRVLVLAASRDKDVEGIVQVLLPLFSRVVVTEYQENPRAVPTSILAKMVRTERSRSLGASSVHQLHVQPEPLDAYRLAKQIANPEDLICVTGSFFIAAELRAGMIADA